MPADLATVDLTAPVPSYGATQMIHALKQYRELQHGLDQQMPDQLLNLDGKVFRKKGYWRALALAFLLTILVEREERTVVGELEDGTPNYMYTVTCRATSPNGRSVIGDGTCTAAEKTRGKLRATEHNVRSHAHTRAFNRAVSNLVGFGEVSAEEIGDEPAPVRSVKKPAARDLADTSFPPMPKPIPPPPKKSASMITDTQRHQLGDVAKELGWKKKEFDDFVHSLGYRTTHEIPSNEFARILDLVQTGGHRDDAGPAPTD